MNKDMVIDKASGGYLSSVMAVTEEVFCYAFVYENIINQDILGGLRTICHFDLKSGRTVHNQGRSKPFNKSGRSFTKRH